MVLLQLYRWKFSHKETLWQSLFDLNWFLFTKMTNLPIEPPFGGLRGNLRTTSIARWKARDRLPIRENWTFFASSYGYDVISRYWSKSALFRGGGSLWAQILVRRGCRLLNVVVVRKLECFATSQWRPRDSIFIHLDRVPACNRRTDGRTELP